MEQIGAIMPFDRDAQTVGTTAHPACRTSTLLSPAHWQMAESLAESAHGFRSKATRWHRVASPILLNETQLTVEMAAIHRLCELVGSLPDLAFDGDSRRYWRFLGLPEHLDDLLTDRGLGTGFFARPDCVLADGSLRVLEMNIGTGTVDITAAAASALYFEGGTPYPAIRELMMDEWQMTELDPSAALAEQLEALGGSRVGLWHHRDTAAARRTMEDMCEVLSVHGINAVPVHTASLPGFDDPLYGFFSTVHMIGDGAFHLCKTIRNALSGPGGPCLVRPGDLPRTAKANLAIVYELAVRGALAEPDAQLVLRHVPETVLLSRAEPGLLARIRREKDDWVIKPNISFKGIGVRVGRRMTRSQWDDSLAQAGDGIGQRFVNCDPMPVLLVKDGQLTVSDTGSLVLMPHFFAGRFAGMSAAYSQHRDVLGRIDFETVLSSLCVAARPRKALSQPRSRSRPRDKPC